VHTLETLKIVPILLVFGCMMLLSPFIAFAEDGDTTNTNCDQSVAECIDQQEQGDTNNQDTDATQDINTFTTFLKFIFALVLIVFLIYWLLKFINKQTKAIQNNHLIQSLGGVGLGPNRSVQVVKIGNKVMVLGVGEDVQLLGEIADEEELKKILAASDHTTNSLPIKNKIFSEIINKITQKQEKKSPFSKILESQLAGIKEKRQEALKSLEKKGDQNE
jgi:flagellar protein FliO/FliZ